MRRTLSNSDEVCHYWANQTQFEGTAGNMFFRDSMIFSYGEHFCIARILPSGAALFTLRGYSPSTSRHISKARSAARHRATLFCNNPAGTARENMDAARDAMNDALSAAEKPRTRQATRDGHKAEALRIAERANAYLAALPEQESAGQTLIDISALESVRAELIAAEQAREQIKREQFEARKNDLLEALQEWRDGKIITRRGLYELPPALRLSAEHWNELGHKSPATVQTSHGAEIPVPDALKLWPIIRRVMSGDKDYSPGAPIGSYRLTKINTDGSIIVGCHAIAHSEIAHIASLLGV